MAPFKALRTLLGLRQQKPKDKWPWDGIKIGRHTYGVIPHKFFSYDETVRFEIGSFCSVANEVMFLVRAEHPHRSVSTFPLKTFANGTGELKSRGPILIGHDVWIGMRSIINSGVTIGNGAVIAAGAVVTKDVRPYEIVGGVPAKHIGYRFEADIVRKLQEIRWWEWSDVKIKENILMFELDVADFILKARTLS